MFDRLIFEFRNRSVSTNRWWERDSQEWSKGRLQATLSRRTGGWVGALRSVGAPRWVGGCTQVVEWVHLGGWEHWDGWVCPGFRETTSDTIHKSRWVHGCTQVGGGIEMGGCTQVGWWVHLGGWVCPGFRETTSDTIHMSRWVHGCTQVGGGIEMGGCTQVGWWVAPTINVLSKWECVNNPHPIHIQGLFPCSVYSPLFSNGSLLLTIVPMNNEHSKSVIMGPVVMREATPCRFALVCAFYWRSLGDCTSGLVASSHNSEEHA